jgi:alkylhydroperoxidase family enzyme
MARISWVEDDDATGPLAEMYEIARRTSPTGQVAAIYRTMSNRPDFLGAIMQAAQLHFSDGALSRAQHEMIASYVAALNRCHY